MMALPILACCQSFDYSATLTGDHHKTSMNEKPISVALDAAMQPNRLAWSPDGSILVVGSESATRSAVALRLSPQGKVVWKLERGLMPEDQGFGSTRPGVHPEWYGLARKSDGQQILCGRMPRRPGNPLPALLNVVNTAGQMLEERLIMPTASERVVVASTFACETWGDGTLLFGHAGTRLWIALLDSSQSLAWQLVLDTVKGGVDATFASGSSSIHINADQAQLVASDNSATEVIVINRSGALLRRTALAGRFVQVEEASADARSLRLVGKRAGVTGQRLLLNTLDERGVASETEAVETSSFIVHRAFGLRDGSIALFGAASNASYSQFRPAAMRVSTTLNPIAKFDFEQSAIFAGDGCRAVARRGESDSFVYALSRTPAQGTDGSGERGLTVGISDF